MLFTNNKNNQCLFFIRQRDKVGDYYQDEPIPGFETGNLVVISSQETITAKEALQKPSVDLGLRYEYVFEDLNNILQVFFDNCTPNDQYLYVAGYLDNTIRIFNLSQKKQSNNKQPVFVLKNHSAKVTCIKFSNNLKYFISCDADGVIVHYARHCHDESGRQRKDVNPNFPFELQRKFQDQMDEIVALDINSTLDMYVTLSTDGTIALRCLRTNQLWQSFMLYAKRYQDINQGQLGQTFDVFGFQKHFSKVISLKLSYQGYIIVIGKSSNTQNVKYLVYTLNGDYLLKQIHEKVSKLMIQIQIEIKDVYLNSTEDQLILAQNFQHTSKEKTRQKQGIIRVVKLYGFKYLGSLEKLFYTEIINLKEKSRSNEDKIVPEIGAFALKRGEANLNIFFCGKGDKEKNVNQIICFDTTRFALFDTLDGFGLGSNAKKYTK